MHDCDSVLVLSCCLYIAVILDYNSPHCSGVQFTAGIYFMMALPIFQLGSNIWTGAWVSVSQYHNTRHASQATHVTTVTKIFKYLFILNSRLQQFNIWE